MAKDRRESKAKYDAAVSAASREIGPLPAVADPARRNAGLDSLEFFALTYFPARFYLPFSDAHRVAIGRLERCTNDGGQFACAMPRGSGKTALAEVAVLRALLYGLRRFVLLVGATERHAARALKRIQAELETNDLLLADFPEACHPIRRLDRIARRTIGQTLGGEPTRMEWTADGVTLPTVPGSACSGAVVQVAGLTGAIRGLVVPGPDGQPTRPDLVVLDDVQTRESAKSPTQTADREAIVSDDVLMLAGPTTRIAAVNLCTVIYPNDLSDRFLDPEQHPEWQGVRTKMLVSFPKRMDLWDRYAEVRRLSLAEGDEGRRATAFYAEHVAEMDEGGEVTWPERKKDGELSGLQSAMNVFYENPRGFHAEFQNDPQVAELADGAKELNAQAVAGRLSGTERHQVPRECTRLTAGFDCGAKLIWWLVAAWTESGGGAVIDYGCWPRQARSHFAASDARPSLADAYKGLTEPQLVFAGLGDATAEVLGRTYFTEGGGEMTVGQALVDSGWQTAAVYQFVRQSPHRAVLFPSKGVGRTTTSGGVGSWPTRPHERPGYHWKLTAPERGRGRTCLFDPDPWKTLLWERLTTAPGAGTALTLFGKHASTHAMAGEHLAAEYSVPATLRGVTFDKWAVRPDRPDNHLLDCAVLAAVAASVSGLKLEAATATGRPVEQPKPPPVRLSEKRARNAVAGPATGPGRMVLSEIQARNRARAGR